MSREKGLLGFSSNFEPQYAQPFDARARVPTKNDLIDPVGWQAADGQQYLYDGLLVVVYADPDPAENGVYRLLDASTFTDPASWENLGTSGAGGDAGGDLSGTYPDPTVAQIQGVPVAEPAAAGARLVYDVTTTSLIWYTIPVYDSLTAAIAGQASQVIGERIIIFATPATDECGTYMVNSLTGVVEDYTKISDRTDTAGEVAIVDTGEHFNSDNVEDALQELGQALEDLPDPGGDLDGDLDNATVVGIQTKAVSTPDTGGTRLVYNDQTDTLVWYSTPVYTSLALAAADQANQVIGEQIIVFADPATSECGTYTVTALTESPGDYTKVSDRTDTAAEVAVVDTGEYFDSDNVEDVLQEVGQAFASLPDPGGDLDGDLDDATVVGIQGTPVDQPSASGARLVYDLAGGTLVWYTTPVYDSLAAAAAAQDNQIIGERVIVFADPATDECGTYELTTKTGTIGDYTKISDRTDTAAEVGIVDTGDYYTGDTVEAALQEIGQAFGSLPDPGGDLDGDLDEAIVVGIQTKAVSTPDTGGTRLVYNAQDDTLVWYSTPVYASLALAAADQANQVIGEHVIVFGDPATSECGTYTVTALTESVGDYTKVSDRTDTAAEVAVVDAGEYFDSDNVEDALQEVGQAFADLPDPGGDLDGTLDDATVVGIQGAPVNQPSVSGARLVYDAAGNTLVWYTTPVYSSLTAAAAAQENQIIGERIIVFATPATEECGTYELTTKTGDIGDYTKISDRTDTAEEVSIVDTGDLYDATEVEGALQEAAIRHRDLLTQGLALGGFLEPETTVSDTFDDGTRTLTLTPVDGSYAFYSEGAVHTKDTADAIQIPDTEGTHYVYYDESGDLVTTQAFTLDIITRYAIVAIIKWDAENQKQIYFGREYRHTTWMGGLTHARLHRVNGYSLAWGGELGDFTIGDGNDDSHARFSSGAAEAWDEDARFLIGARLATGDLPVYYRQGDDSLNIWRIFEGGAQASFPVRTDGAGRAYFNELDAANWQLVEADNNSYILAFVVLTNDTDRHFAAIMGQGQYPNANTARNAVADAVNTLLTDGMPVEEFKFLGAVILQTSNSYTNTVKSRVIEVETGVPYLDLRGSVIGRQGVDISGGDHNLLANLQGGQTNEYYHLTEEQHDRLTNADTETDEIPSAAGPVEIGRVLAGSTLTTVEWAVTIYHEGAEQISRYNIIASVIGAEDPSLTVSGLGPDYGHDFTAGVETGPPDYFALYVEPDGAGWKTIVTRTVVHRA